MPSIYDIKPKFQKLLTPVLEFLYRSGITANQITISALVLSIIIGVSFWYASYNQLLFLALPIGLFLRMALNALDGMMARTYNQQSKLGEILNELGDIISDTVIYFPLLVYESEHIYLVVAFLCLTILNECAGILGKVISGERRYDGPMGKSDRAFLIGIYGLLSFFSVPLSKLSFWIFIVLNLLLVMSTINRVKNTLKHAG